MEEKAHKTHDEEKTHKTHTELIKECFDGEGNLDKAEERWIKSVLTGGQKRQVEISAALDKIGEEKIKIQPHISPVAVPSWFKQPGKAWKQSLRNYLSMERSKLLTKESEEKAAEKFKLRSAFDPTKDPSAELSSKGVAAGPKEEKLVREFFSKNGVHIHREDEDGERLLCNIIKLAGWISTFNDDYFLVVKKLFDHGDMPPELTSQLWILKEKIRRTLELLETLEESSEIIAIAK